jgi:hypothetical protein
MRHLAIVEIELVHVVPLSVARVEAALLAPAPCVRCTGTYRGLGEVA